MYYIYIISNKNNTVFYTGVTNSLVRRVYEHKNKLADSFTSKYCIDRLLYFESTDRIESAIAREKQIKKYGQKKKFELILKKNRNLNDLYERLAP